MKHKPKEYSAKDAAIKAALTAGFSHDGSAIISPSGHKQHEFAESSGYMAFTLPKKYTGRSTKVPSHRFISAFYLGVACLDAECIRHLDGNKKNNLPSNLMPGSSKENRLDVPKEIRSASTTKTLPSRIAAVRKLTDEQILQIRSMRKSTKLSYRSIGEAFNVAGRTVCHVCSGTRWSNI